MSTRTAMSNASVVPEVSQGQAAAASEGQVSGGELAGVNQLKADLHTFLYENPNPILAAGLNKLEVLDQKNLKREYVVYAFSGLVALLLLLGVGHGAGFVCNVLIGAAYPIFASLRVVRSQDKSQNVQLLTYWTLFGGLLLLDSIFAEVPVYFLLKAAALLALFLPQIRGSELLYVKAIEPALVKLDALLNKKSE